MLTCRTSPANTVDKGWHKREAEGHKLPISFIQVYFDYMPDLPSGQGIGSCLACHKFEPGTTKDPPCRGRMHVKSVKSSNVLRLVWCSG
ncbi:hypothetical protein TNCV_4987221 [Trichonephila clavipes]|nr:hypothetical protein TNCV_4987221 [Trichonephila clavipes]